VSSCIVSRCSPPIRASYEDHREDLRSDFVFSCAYCSTTEIEARGFGFEIDHYQPQLHGGKDDYVNLYWSCRNCNKKKTRTGQPRPEPPLAKRSFESIIKIRQITSTWPAAILTAFRLRHRWASALQHCSI